jgi:hypothetical protein
MEEDYPEYVVSFFLRGDASPLCGLLRSDDPLPRRLRDFIAAVLEGDVRVYTIANPKRKVWTPFIAKLERDTMKARTNRYRATASAFGKSLDPEEAYQVYRFARPDLPRTRRKAEELFATTVTGNAVRKKIKTRSRG